jgi:small subunit ribosomal protein S7
MAKDEKKEDSPKVEAKAKATPEPKPATEPKVKEEKPKKPAKKAADKEPAKKAADKKPAKKAADKKPAKEAAAKKPAKKAAETKVEKEAPAKEKAADKKPAKKSTKKKPSKKAEEKAEEEAEKPKKKPAKKPSKKKEEKASEEPKDEMVEHVDEKTDRRVQIAIKPLFGKYTFSGVVVPNPGLQRYINIEPVSIPHTGARHANRPFAKMHMNIVERLINGMMRTQHGTGQKAKMYRVVEEAFGIIESRTKKNPIQVYIDALCNSAPKEEVTRLRYGGINVPKAVDVSASRRLDIALRNVCKGTMNSSQKSRKRLPQCLADELILASKMDINSFAVSKKEEVERIAASAR